MSTEIVKEAVVIGCGISGLATARWLKVNFSKYLQSSKTIILCILKQKYNIDYIAIERTNDIGGSTIFFIYISLICIFYEKVYGDTERMIMVS
jgi:hypothetical protein